MATIKTSKVGRYGRPVTISGIKVMFDLNGQAEVDDASVHFLASRSTDITIISAPEKVSPEGGEEGEETPKAPVAAKPVAPAPAPVAPVVGDAEPDDHTMDREDLEILNVPDLKEIAKKIAGIDPKSVDKMKKSVLIDTILSGIVNA